MQDSSSAWVTQDITEVANSMSNPELFSLETDFTNNDLTRLFLFQYGADPNKLDLHGRTPLVCAIRGCRVYPWNGLNVIKAILRFGCDVNLRGKFDLSVIMAQEEQAYSAEDLQVWHFFFCCYQIFICIIMFSLVAIITLLATLILHFFVFEDAVGNSSTSG